MTKSYTWATSSLTISLFIVHTCALTSHLLLSVDCEARVHDIWPFCVNKVKHFQVQRSRLSSKQCKLKFLTWIMGFMSPDSGQNVVFHYTTDHNVQAIKVRKLFEPTQWNQFLLQEMVWHLVFSITQFKQWLIFQNTHRIALLFCMFQVFYVHIPALTKLLDVLNSWDVTIWNSHVWFAFFPLVPLANFHNV